jgi:ribonuclease Z
MPELKKLNREEVLTMRKVRETGFFVLLIVLAVGVAIGYISRNQSSETMIHSAEAAEDEIISPTGVLSDRDVYYPGTEELRPDEMRVIACGTGMPNARPKQAAACWLVELGNGDKFLFDIGFGSAERIAAMKIPYDYLDKVFLGHLHGDHVGDLDALWIGGVTGNRVKPLRVWGPSGNKPEYGTKHYIKYMKKAYTWDKASRLGNVDIRGLEIQVNEFDYKGENQIVYDENGVVIRSFPAIHGIDGSISYTLEWNGIIMLVI